MVRFVHIFLLCWKGIELKFLLLSVCVSSTSGKIHNQKIIIFDPFHNISVKASRPPQLLFHQAYHLILEHNLKLKHNHVHLHRTWPICIASRVSHTSFQCKHETNKEPVQRRHNFLGHSYKENATKKDA